MTKRKYLPLHASYALESAEAELAALIRLVDRRLDASLQLIDEATYCRIRSHAASAQAALAVVEREGANGNGGNGVGLGDSADDHIRSQATRGVGR